MPMHCESHRESMRQGILSTRAHLPKGKQKTINFLRMRFSNRSESLPDARRISTVHSVPANDRRAYAGKSVKAKCSTADGSFELSCGCKLPRDCFIRRKIRRRCFVAPSVLTFYTITDVERYAFRLSQLLDLRWSSVPMRNYPFHFSALRQFGLSSSLTSHCARPCHVRLRTNADIPIASF